MKDAKEKHKRQRGVITQILSRRQTEFVGSLQMNKGFAFFVADTDKKCLIFLFILQSSMEQKTGIE